MKILLVASAHGGSGKTTACVRLAECLTGERIPAAVLDLSPHPSAPYMTSLPVVAGRTASSEVAARAIVRPYEDRTQVMVADTGSFDDRVIDTWLPLVDALLLVTRIDKLPVAALPAAWPRLEEVRAKRPRLLFAGLLPMMVTPRQEALCQTLRQRMREAIHPEAIPFDVFEHERLQRGCFVGVEQPPATSPGLEAWRRTAKIVAARMGLQPIAPPPEPERTGALGALARLWKKAVRGATSSPTVRKEAMAP